MLQPKFMVAALSCLCFQFAVTKKPKGEMGEGAEPMLLMCLSKGQRRVSWVCINSLFMRGGPYTLTHHRNVVEITQGLLNYVSFETSANWTLRWVLTMTHKPLFKQPQLQLCNCLEITTWYFSSVECGLFSHREPAGSCHPKPQCLSLAIYF